MPLPQYLPIELALQNYGRGMMQWKLLYHMAEQRPGNAAAQEQFNECDHQLQLRAKELIAHLEKPLV